MALRLCTRTSTLPCARKGLAIIDCSAIRHFSLTHRLHEATHWGKYSDKLQKVAEDRGKSVDDLKADLLAQELEKRKERLKAAAEAIVNSQTAASDAAASSTSGTASPGVSKRSDSSPVKPLNEIFNLARLLEKPHTAEQISVLWQAYHASRSGGTGRGYICASLPVATYQKLLDTGRKYPTFVLPLERPLPSDGTSPNPAESSEDKAYEFYFLQWAQHGSPPVPSYERETALFPGRQTGAGGAQGTNPPTSTVLLTPLQEYKLRQTFATPYLSLTFYSDLAASHGLVLLRGELTPSAASPTAPNAGKDGDVRFFLSQEDAQMLAVGLQQFYLWSGGKEAKKREELLKVFHERPEEFKWEELLKHAQVA